MNGYCFAVNMRRALSRQEGALPVSQSPPLVLIVLNLNPLILVQGEQTLRMQQLCS
jgi:hypothetical protein